MISPQIIHREYSSGFQAEIILKPEFKQRFFGIIIDFGSSDPQEFPGTAHFLEHKLFAKKDGDLSGQFEKLGADVNAFTSFNETMFYCTGVDHNPKLIQLLFRLVGEPYFTKQNVAQEAPIIEQELAMYQDEPDWLVDHNLMKEMFANSNLGLDVAGTRQSIMKINESNLLSAYQKNYVPSKMHFVTCGDFSSYQCQMILRLVNKLQAQYFKDKKGKISYESKKGKLRDLTIATKGKSNIFGLGIRLTNFKKVLSSLDLAQILLEIMLESKLSVMSPWFEKMKQKNWLANSLQITVNYTRQGNFITIFGVSQNSAEVIKAIKDEIRKPFSKSNLAFMKHFLTMQKKEWLAQFIRGMDNVPYLAIEMAEESLDHENSFASLEKLQNMSFNDFLSYCSALMKDSEFCSARLVRKDLH